VLSCERMVPAHPRRHCPHLGCSGPPAPHQPCQGAAVPGILRTAPASPWHPGQAHLAESCGSCPGNEDTGLETLPSRRDPPVPSRLLSRHRPCPVARRRQCWAAGSARGRCPGHPANSPRPLPAAKPATNPREGGSSSQGVPTLGSGAGLNPRARPWWVTVGTSAPTSVHPQDTSQVHLPTGGNGAGGGQGLEKLLPRSVGTAATKAPATHRSGSPG